MSDSENKPYSSEKPGTIIFIFLDGVGLGLNNKENNPFSRFATEFFECHGGKTSFSPPGDLIETDAHMGIAGLPQSATGQTALFCGYNGPQIMGRHINGFPTFTLRPYIKEYSIIKTYLENNLKATLLNSYSPFYLKRLEHKRYERMISASTLMQLGSNQPVFTLEDYRAGRSLYMDITNWFLRSKGLDIPVIKPEETGRKLVKLAQPHDLVIYEYFFTDKTGHAGSMGAARRILPHIDGLIRGVYEQLDPTKDLLIVSSDHGNIEDLSAKVHTENKVGTLVYGRGSEYLKKNVTYLYDIARGILNLAGIKWIEKTPE